MTTQEHQDKKKAELKDKLDATIKQMKANSKDQHFADKLIGDMLSIKGQQGIEPTELHIETKDVLFNHNYGTFEVIKTKNEIIYATNGYRVVIKAYATGRTYEMLDVICMLQEKVDKEEKLDEQEQQTLDTLIYFTSIMNIPLFAFIDDEMTTAMFETLMTQIGRIYKEVDADTLPEDDQAKNEEFKERIELGEQLEKESKEDEK